MKNILLKVKIILTNISRIIISFLFINLNFSSANKVFAEPIPVEMTCYEAGPPIEAKDTLTLKNVLIILVPVAIIVGVVSLIIIKKRNKLKEKDNAKKD